MVLNALKAYGYEPDPHVVETFTKYRKTHNDGVFDAYTADVRRCRSSHILTGLPDAYGRGRIIGDYRRVALYGVDRLIERKQRREAALDRNVDRRDHPRPRGAVRADPRAQASCKEMARATASTSRARRAPRGSRAVALLRLPRRREGAERRGDVARPHLDLPRHLLRARPRAGTLTEEQAQEIIDDFVIKLRIVRFLRTPEYDELFAGDPTWVTESIGGMGDDGRPLVTKTSFRFLQTLYNLGPAPEPNLTIWYSPRCPTGSAASRAKVAIDTSSIQFESDEIMRARGATTARSPAASRRCGRQADAVLRRAREPRQVPALRDQRRPRRDQRQAGRAARRAGEGDYLDFDDVLEVRKMMDWLAGVYVNAMNVIHYMHDKYAYERIEMALHDYAPLRTMAFGIAGMSVVADSLSAIKYAKVKVVRDETGLITSTTRPKASSRMFGNNDNRVDQLAAWLVSTFMNKLRKYPTYRNALHTQSVLTITSNVVYGKAPATRRTAGARASRSRRAPTRCTAATATASTPRPRRSPRFRTATRGRHLADDDAGPDRPRPVARGPDHNLTRSSTRSSASTGFHMNVNVLNRETLLDAMDHPEKYPSLTIRVSGYAVNFVRLTREQQMDVINRTFHGE
jgi:formate C-acetyltransferase